MHHWCAMRRVGQDRHDRCDRADLHLKQFTPDSSSATGSTSCEPPGPTHVEAGESSESRERERERAASTLKHQRTSGSTPWLKERESGFLMPLQRLLPTVTCFPEQIIVLQPFQAGCLTVVCSPVHQMMPILRLAPAGVNDAAR